MGIARNFFKEKLVCGILTSDPGLDDALFASLEKLYGPLDYTSKKIDFSFTFYYNSEMGTPITRRFVSFGQLVDPGRLAQIKNLTNALETGFSQGGRRKVNLDPGLLCLSRFVLASTKESSHRIPLTDGIHAEICLMYEHGAFRPVEWTYSDYRSPEYLAVLKEIREIYRVQLQAGDAIPPSSLA